MKAVLRVGCMTALALVCLDGHAKAGCVTTLEARPERLETTATTQRPCPTAVGHVLQRSSNLRAASAPAVPPSALRHV